MFAKRSYFAAAVAITLTASPALACASDNGCPDNRPGLGVPAPADPRSAEPSPKAREGEAVKPLTAPLPEARKPPKTEAPGTRNACSGTTYCQ